MRVVLIGVGLLITAVLAFFLITMLREDGPRQETETSASIDSTIDAQENAGIIPPTFDIVRVEPTGSAVVAGRAEPGTEIILFANKEEIARETADERGEWVIIVEAPLDQGDQELTLEMILPDGTNVASDQTVVVAVPEQPGLKPLVVLQGGASPSRVLQQPGDGVMVGDLSVDIVDYDEAGAVILQGRAKPGTTIRAYVDNRRVGDARTDLDGNWRMMPDQAIPPGRYTLRIDQLTDAGKPTARVEIPFERAAPESTELSAGQVIVQPGNSLWRISRRLYGRGILYTVIYDANKSQIVEPDLIYSGQVFDTPVSPSAMAN